MRYELMNNLSGTMVLLTVTLVFSLVFEPRYPRKKYLKSLLPFLTVLLAVNIVAIFQLGFAMYGSVTLFIATLPSLLYFFLVSKHRDGRFFFTFCLVDTSSIWFATLTGMLDYMLGSEGLFNFAIRCLLAPVILFAVHRWMRKPFLSLLNTVKKGWWLFTAMTGMVYALLLLLTSFPVSLRDRPDDIPLTMVILVFLPLTYATIFYVLVSQQKLHDMGNLQHALSAQSAMIEARAREFRTAEDKLRIQRHDMRHQLKVIEELAVQGEPEEILKYLGSIQSSLDDTAVPHYCTNPILDAILSSYFRQAEELGIQVEAHLSLPDALPVPAAELATVLANALENAIHACSSLPAEQRRLICTCTSRPSLVFTLENPYTGEIRMDENGLPISMNTGHGIGTRSIAAFCRKHDAACYCEADQGWFRLMLNL